MGVFSAIGGFFKRTFSATAQLLGAVEEFEIGVFDFVYSVTDDAKAFAANLRQLSTFDFDPKFRTRVINVPRAEEGFKNLWEEVTQTIPERFREIERAVEALKNFVEHGSQISDTGPSAAGDFVSKIATIKLLLDQVKSAVHAALDLESLVLDVKRRVETLDDLFLSQKNPRRVSKEKRFIRVGAMHR